MAALRGLVGLVALVLVVQLVLSSEIDPKNPVRSAEQDQVKDLPGLKFSPNFKHYSGYLEADDKRNRFWHYWFVESQGNPEKDPLVLWLNGGPGCSSLLGLLTELGPFAVDSDGSVVENHFAWNKRANVIFLESPAGVGFSYAADGDITADDDTTAAQNHKALKSFLEKFPQYKSHKLYLTGESYAGVYLPTLAVLVEQDPEMNLKGVAIGNGYLDAQKLAESLIYFGYYHGLFGRSLWNSLSTNCCDGKPPARGDCRFTDSKRSNECSELITQATDVILSSGLNPYNLYDICAKPPKSELGARQMSFVGRELFDRSLVRHAFNSTGGRRSKISKVLPRTFDVVRNDPPCTDDTVVINYLNRDDVKESLHIPKGLASFTTCFEDIKYTMIYPLSKNGLAPQINKLIESKRKLTLLVYNGDVDMMCNFLGDEWFVDDLKRKVISQFTTWSVDGQVSGFVKHYEGITYMTVKGSGHMVPTDKPAEALKMFNTFLYGHEKADQA